MTPKDDRSCFQPEALAKLADLELRARRVVEGIVSGMQQSPYRGQSVEFAQHREYVPGDDLRHLDWRVFGRSDRFYVKQYEEETNLRAHLLLDASASMRYPDAPTADGRPDKFAYAATMAAALAYLLINQSDAVGLTLFDDDLRGELPPLSNHAHFQSIVHQMQQARLDRPTADGSVFERLATLLRRRGMVILLSDLLADAGEIIRAIRRLCHAGHELIVMHVLDRDEREFPFQENTRFEGLEAADQQLLTDPQSLRRGYLEALSAFTTEIRAACENARADFVELSTGEPVDVALRRFLVARQRLMKAKA